VDTDGQGKVTAFAYYKRLQRVKCHVERNLADEVSLQTAAQVAGLEQKYFSTFFRQKTGICFSDWVARERVSRATQMLKKHNYSITCVAQDVGFHNLRTFERAFKKVTGMTPREFKRSVHPR
jgi:two-component system, response regulator YesN